MTMRHNRHLSTCVYMGVTAVNDSLVLSINFHRWLHENTPLYFFTDWGCKIIIYLVHISGTFAAYEITLMTLDKLIAIKFPHKSAFMCTARRAKIFSVINFIVVSIFFLPNLDFSSSVGNGDCARYVKRGWYVTVYSYISLILSPVIPVASLFIMNGVIIKAVWESQRMRHTTQTRDRDSVKSTEVQLTIMLILVSSLFVILLLPFEVREIYYSIVSKAETPKQFATFVFVLDFTYELYNLNYGINFYLYFISGTKFRNDLRALFGSKSKQRNNVKNVSGGSIETKQESLSD